MCEYCQWQQDGEGTAFMQEGGKPMYMCNGDQLAVEDSNGNAVSHATINYCPMCGEPLM